MFSLLVVDDEEFAVKGITQGIYWKGIGITDIYEAYGAASAKEIISSEHIDVAICDIEMPGCNGIELLKWIRENSCETKTIILTGHADFQYAQKAVQLNCDDYLLKPVEHEHLKQVVSETLQVIQNEREQIDRTEAYRKYFSMWESQKPAFIEHYWRDILDGRVVSAEKDFYDTFRLYGIPMDDRSYIRLVLLKAEQWTDTYDAGKRDVIGLAIRNMASEILFKPADGVIVQDQNRDTVAVYYCMDTEKTDPAQEKEFEEKCRKLIATCNEELKCYLSCYIGEPVGICSTAKAYQKLVEVERENINRSNSVTLQREACENVKRLNRVPQFLEWGLLLELGRKEELLKQIHHFLYNADNENASRELLDSFYHGIMSMLYALLHQNGISLNSVLSSKALVKEGLEAGTVHQAEKWACTIIGEVERYYSEFRKSESFIVSEIKNYIEKNIYCGFTREDVALALHFNPDYLSRVFKKETGKILSDYITFCRIKAAKKLLEDTGDKIGDIADRLGYSQFSHFAKVFRSITGMSPQEYRKSFRKSL